MRLYGVSITIRFTNNDFQHIIGNFALDSCLRDLKSVYKISHQKEVDPNHREIVKKLEISVMKLHNQFKVPITPKLHIVFEHLPEYFEMTGKTLRKKTDQTVEATHSKLDNIKHFNSYNLGIKD